jgi:hypothetical protein
MTFVRRGRFLDCGSNHLAPKMNGPNGDPDIRASVASGSKDREARLCRAGVGGLRGELVRGTTPSRRRSRVGGQMTFVRRGRFAGFFSVT